MDSRTGPSLQRWRRRRRRPPGNHASCEFGRPGTTARPAPSDQPSAWSPATVKRLKTLCTMAASALLRHDWQNAELSQPAGRDLEPIPNALAIASARTDRDLDETKTKANHFAAAVFQDATFLHAILPFAV